MKTASYSADVIAEFQAASSVLTRRGEPKKEWKFCLTHRRHGFFGLRLRRIGHCPAHNDASGLISAPGCRAEWFSTDCLHDTESVLFVCWFGKLVLPGACFEKGLFRVAGRRDLELLWRSARNVG